MIDSCIKIGAMKAAMTERRNEVLRLLDLLPEAIIRDTLGWKAAEIVRGIDPEKATARDLSKLRDLCEQFVSL